MINIESWIYDYIEIKDHESMSIEQKHEAVLIILSELLSKSERLEDEKKENTKRIDSLIYMYEASRTENGLFIKEMEKKKKALEEEYQDLKFKMLEEKVELLHEVKRLMSEVNDLSLHNPAIIHKPFDVLQGKTG